MTGPAIAASLANNVIKISNLLDSLTWMAARLGDSHEREAVYAVAAACDEIAKVAVEEANTLHAQVDELARACNG